MNVVSITFLCFAAVLLVLYYRIPQKEQWVLLLAASYLFYLWAGIKYLFFILFTTGTVYATAYAIGRQLEQQRNYLKIHRDTITHEERSTYKAAVKRRNRLCMLSCVIANFLLLAGCKLSLVEPFRSMLQEGRLSFLSLGLPMGISFYLFQSTGYLIDVYHEKVKPERNLFRFALFVSYFPQLLQGPISKYSQLTKTLYGPHPFDGKQVSFGLQRVLWGYFKKMVIADRIAVAVIALKAPEYTGAGFFVLTIFYAIQIYCDFTGGIDIAIGLSEALGIVLPENFIRPYFSKNIAEYWRRWHISLGEWMKDYIFYPISVCKPMLKLARVSRKHLGNFGKRVPVYVASIVTWFVTGIWHGITPNFVIWGMMNCLVIVISEELAPLYQRFHDRFHLKEKSWYGGFEILRMFILMNLIRVCDLFPHVGDYFARVGSLFTSFHVSFFYDGSLLKLGLTGLDYGIIAFGVLLVFTVSVIQEKYGSVREILAKHYAFVRYSIVYVLFLLVLLMGNYGVGYHAANFIYNQF